MPINRREFVVSAAALASGAFMRVDFSSQKTAVDADALFRRAVIIDGLSADEDWNDPEPIFAAYKKANLSAIYTTLNPANLAISLRDLSAWQARFDRWPDRMMKIEKGAQIAEARKAGRLAVILGFQNGTMIEQDVANLEKLYAAGTRCIQPTYNEHNLLGDGCTQKVDGGLSAFGHTVVERMNELGIILDLSHCGLKTSRDGIAASKRPPAFTHTTCTALYNHVRSKPDDLLKAVSDKGGMNGMMTLGYMVGPTPETSVDDYLKHVDHAVKISGIDHVGLASDYSIRGIGATRTRENWYVPRLSSFPPDYHVRWPPWIAELDPPERFLNITRGLAARGYSTTEIEKILGGNWVRFFTELLR